MTLRELFDKVRVRKTANDSIMVEVSLWEHEDGRIDFGCRLWSARQCRGWNAKTPEEALAAFLQTYTGKPEEKADELQVAAAGEIPVEPPPAPEIGPVQEMEPIISAPTGRPRHAVDPDAADYPF